MPFYRAYLIENGQVWAAVDLSCADDDAKNKQNPLWMSGISSFARGDRRVAVLNRSRGRFPLAADMSVKAADDAATHMKEAMRRAA
jgi:hypothetical protein